MQARGCYCHAPCFKTSGCTENINTRISQLPAAIHPLHLLTCYWCYQCTEPLHHQTVWWYCICSTDEPGGRCPTFFWTVSTKWFSGVTIMLSYSKTDEIFFIATQDTHIAPVTILRPTHKTGPVWFNGHSVQLKVRIFTAPGDLLQGSESLCGKVLPQQLH